MVKESTHFRGFAEGRTGKVPAISRTIPLPWPWSNVRYWWKADVDWRAGCWPFHRMRDDPLAVWPDHMKVVFRLIGGLMAGKRLSPELLRQLPHDRSIIAEHQVTVSHTRAEELPGTSGQYTVVITGKRIDGRWQLWPGELERLSRHAASEASDVG
jgi:hypothetical protein